MRKYKIVQLQFNAFRDAVVDKNVIGEMASYEAAVDYLVKRNYVYHEKDKRWINGNTVHYPVIIVEPKRGFNLDDIGSFI